MSVQNPCVPSRPAPWLARFATLLSVTLAILLLSLPAAAHDLWIQPADFAPPVARPTAVELRVGVGFPGERVPRRDAHTQRFALLGSSGEVALTGVDGVSPAGIARLPAAGDFLLVYRSDDSAITLDAAAFEAYLKEEGLEHVSRLRAERGETGAPGRELFSRSVKSLLAIPVDGPTDTDTEVEAGAGAEDGASTSLHTLPAGLPLELVPETRPADLEPGDELTLRLLLRGEPLAGAKVRAEWRPDGEAGGPGTSASEASTQQAERSDADGRVTLRLSRAGVWKIATVHMEAVTDEPPVPADWRSTWTSLTFEVMAGGANAEAIGR